MFVSDVHKIKEIRIKSSLDFLHSQGLGIIFEIPDKQTAVLVNIDRIHKNKDDLLLVITIVDITLWATAPEALLTDNGVPLRPAMHWGQVWL